MPEEIKDKMRLEENRIRSTRMTEKEKNLSEWVPKTALGKMVQRGEITSIEQIFEKNMPILEPEIVDSLLEVEEKIVDTKKTARVVRSGRKFSFRITVLVGNKNGCVGLGVAKDVEKWPAVRKAARNAKLNLIKVARGSGSWEEQMQAKAFHSVPFKVKGKCGSVRVTLLPAPKGTGLVTGDNIKDVFRFAGITDVWSKTSGATDTKLNFLRATVNALAQTTKARASDDVVNKLSEQR